MLVVSYYLYYRNLTEIYIYCNKSAEHLSPGLSTSSSLGNWGEKRKRKYVNVMTIILNYFMLPYGVKLVKKTEKNFHFNAICFIIETSLSPHPSTSRSSSSVYSVLAERSLLSCKSSLPLLAPLDAGNRARFLWGWDLSVGRCTRSGWVSPSPPGGQEQHPWVLQKLREERDGRPHRTSWLCPSSAWHPDHLSTALCH